MVVVGGLVKQAFNLGVLLGGRRGQQAGDRFAPGQLRRAPATLAVLDHVLQSVGADEDRVLDPAQADVGGEFLQRGFVEDRARLLGVRHQIVEWDVDHAPAHQRHGGFNDRFRFCGGSHRWAPKGRDESRPYSWTGIYLASGSREVPGSPSPLCVEVSAMTSLALGSP